MRKQRTFIRLMALLLLLPVLLTAACSFAAMAEGDVILEDPALIGDLEDAMADLVMEPVKQTEGEPAPTQETAAEPSVEPSQEPTAEPSAHPSAGAVRRAIRATLTGTDRRAVRPAHAVAHRGSCGKL